MVDCIKILWHAVLLLISKTMLMINWLEGVHLFEVEWAFQTAWQLVLFIYWDQQRLHRQVEKIVQNSWLWDQSALTWLEVSFDRLFMTHLRLSMFWFELRFPRYLSYSPWILLLTMLSESISLVNFILKSVIDSKMLPLHTSQYFLHLMPCPHCLLERK